MQRLSMRFDFEGAQGDRLSGRLEMPVGKPQAFALFAHCFTCSKDVFAAARVSRALAERGIAVLRFDFTGLGSSDGEFANTNFSSNVEDLVAANHALGAQFEAPRLFIGHSLGGAAVLAAALDCPNVEAVATIGAPADPAHVTHNFAASEAEIRESGEARVSLAGRDFTIRKQFLDDLESSSFLDRLGDDHRALLILHSPEDATVEIDNALKLFDAASFPKSLISLDGADHLLSRRADAVHVAAMIESWAGRALRLGPYAVADEQAGPAVSESVLVTETGEGRLSNLVYAGGHVLPADEPEAMGGNNTGPTPYEYLLAALGACTSMTLRLYAERKEWPVERIAVRLRHEKVHRQDSDAADSGKAAVIDRIDRELSIDAPSLTGEQLERLREIADKCPVHRTLERVPEVITALDSTS